MQLAWELRAKIHFGTEEEVEARQAEDNRQIDLLLRGAEILSRLVSAPPDVGFSAGTWIVAEEQRQAALDEEEKRRLRASLFGDVMYAPSSTETPKETN